MVAIAYNYIHIATWLQNNRYFTLIQKLGVQVTAARHALDIQYLKLTLMIIYYSFIHE